VHYIEQLLYNIHCSVTLTILAVSDKIIVRLYVRYALLYFVVFL